MDSSKRETNIQIWNSGKRLARPHQGGQPAHISYAVRDL